MKKLENVDLSKIKTIFIVNDELITASIQNDGEALVLDSGFNPTIVDSNFTEVANRINKLENEINILKSVIKQ